MHPPSKVLDVEVGVHATYPHGVAAMYDVNPHNMGKEHTRFLELAKPYGCQTHLHEIGAKVGRGGGGREYRHVANLKWEHCLLT